MTAETKPKSERRTTSVPVTTMEELPVLDENERNDLDRVLEQAAADREAGKAVTYDSEAFRDRLVRIYRDKS